MATGRRLLEQRVNIAATRLRLALADVAALERTAALEDTIGAARHDDRTTTALEAARARVLTLEARLITAEEELAGNTHPPTTQPTPRPRRDTDS